jgi:hypothetical protein
VALPAGVSRSKSSHILLDNQSAVHIFNNKKLLNKPLRQSDIPLHLGGIVNGQVLKTQWLGTFLDIAVGNVWFSSQAAANILSLHLLHEDGFYSHYNSKDDTFCLSTPNDGVLVFEWDENIEHYVCNFDCHVRKKHDKTQVGVAFPTIAENSAKYPARQVKAATAARELLQRAGFPSTGKLKELVNSGNLVNTQTSVQDLERATDIFGPDVAALKGKTRKLQPTSIALERPRSVIRGALVMHVDIVFMRGVPYLLSVTTPLGYLMVDVLSEGAKPVGNDELEKFSRRSTTMIRKALFKMFNAYRARNYTVEKLLTDQEGGVLKLSGEIEALGCVMNPGGPGQHVPLVEHKAKLLKERRRCHIHHVPFALPFIFERYLISHCVFTLNIMPTKTRGDHIAPAADFFGRKIDTARDLRFTWGDLCHAHNPNNTVTNSDRARTDACVLLLSTGNLNGSVMMMNLATWTVVTRDQWTLVPYDQTTLGQINSRALADDVSLSTQQRSAHRAKDAIFRRLHGAILGAPDDDDLGLIPDENPPTMHEEAPTDDVRAPISPDVAPTVLEDTPDDRQTADQGGVDDPSTDISPINDPQTEVQAPVTPVVDVSSTSTDPPDSPNEVVSTMETIDDTCEVVEDDLMEQDDSPSTSRYNLRHPKKYPTSTVFASFHRRRHHRCLLAAHKPDIIAHISAAKALKKMRGAAIRSIVKELANMCDKSVWKAVDIKLLTTKQLRKIIRSSMFIKEKYRADGSFEKLKARLVAGGHMQDRSDYGDVSSPVVSTLSVNLLAALAAKEKRKVYCIDIGSAFLNADMSGDNVLMRLDPLLADILCKMDHSYSQFLDSRDGSLVVHLTKALYGCIRSSMLWYNTLLSFLIECGFKQNAYDSCVLNRTISNNRQCTVCFHVDDLLVTTNDALLAEELIRKLKQRFGEITVHTGAVHNYLGAVFDFTECGKVKISMPHHTQQLVQDSGITGNASSPAATDLFDIDNNSPALTKPEKEWFHSFVHRIMYLANRLNGECLVSCAFLSSRTQAPTRQDMNKLVRVLQYLHKNPNLELTLTIGDDLQVIQYTDASYGVHADGKSHTGSCITLGGGAVHARSVKQKINTKSSTEAELVGLSDEASRGLWCTYFLQHQGYQVSTVNEMQDNMSTIAMANKGSSSAQRTRHIKIRYYWIKDYIDRDEMTLQHVSTKDMIADGLSKPLQGMEFIRMRSMLLNTVPHHSTHYCDHLI